MYKGTHRLVKIYQGMKARTKVTIVAGVLAIATAATVVPSLAVTSAVSYADTSVEVSSILGHPFVAQSTLSLLATGIHSGTPVQAANIPPNGIPVTPLMVGEVPASITPVATNDSLTFTASNSGPDTFVVSSANVPTAISWTTTTTSNSLKLVATVTPPELLPTANATVTVKVTDANGDVAFDTVTFAPTASSTFNVTQTQDFVPSFFPTLTSALVTNNNTTGNADFFVPTGDSAVLTNAPSGVAMVGNTLAASSAAPGEYDGVKLAVADAAGATSVESFSLTVHGARVGYQGPKLSQGHAVKINSAREWVYFVLSGQPSWVHFTIVGPGKINGHQGWVNGKLGLNAAFYAGLLGNHHYEVFYQPVTGPGSTDPVPGSKMGVVDFVS